jgi:hypothetical protein
MKSVTSVFFAAPLALVATVVFNDPSQAQSLTFANKVESYNAGYATYGGRRTTVEDGRDNPEEALGAFNVPTGNVYNSGNQKFLSLGLGGSAVFSFGTLFQNQVRLWETTWGFKSGQNAYDEQVDVYVGNSLDNWTFAKTVKNIADGAYNTKTGTVVNLAQGETYQYVKLVDKSARVRDRDGWDISAIAVESATSSSAAVPEPATMAGMALASLGMTIVRRKAKKQAA